MAINEATSLLAILKSAGECFILTLLDQPGQPGSDRVQEEAFQKLLKSPQLAEPLDSQHRTLLHFASAYGYIDIVKRVNMERQETCLEMCLARDRDGANPLHVAAMRGKVDVLIVLLDANPHAARARVNSEERETILHLCVKYNKPEVLSKLLEKYFIGTDFVNAKDSAGNTILHLAVEGQNFQIVKYVLEHTNIKVNAINASKQTARDILPDGRKEGMKPEEWKNIQEIEGLLVNKGATRAVLTKFISWISLDGGLQLELCHDLLHCSPELAKALDSQPRLCLHLAAAEGNIEIVKAIIKVRPEMCLARNKDGANPLHVAAMRGKVGVLCELFKANPHAARDRVANAERETILHLCVKYNQLKFLSTLLEKYFKGEEFVNAKDNDGNTILQTANATVEMGHLIIEYLICCTEIDANAINTSKQTAMDILLLGQKKGTEPAERSIDRDIQALLEIGYTFRVQDGVVDPTEIAGKRNGIIVAAVLMAILAFQAGMAPPGGVWQDDKDGHESGKSVMASNYPLSYLFFLFFNVVGFISSVGTVVIFMMTDLPFKPGRYWLWTCITEITAITSIAIAFFISVFVVSPPYKQDWSIVSRFGLIEGIIFSAFVAAFVFIFVAVLDTRKKRMNRAVERVIRRRQIEVIY